MKISVYRMPRAGNIHKLALRSEELPEPAADEVQIEVKAVGLNFADIFAMQGLYSATPEGSFIPGLEFSGVIVKTGEKVKDRKVGERVMGATRFGGYVNYINHHHLYVQPIPEDWSFEEGAAFLVQGLTAYYALIKLGDIKPGMNILIHSAAGGVGILANRIAKKMGAYTIGTVGRPGKLEYLKNNESYDRIIVRGKNFGEQLEEALGERELNLIMECIGGDVLKAGWDRLAPMGRMIAYGSASFTSHSARPDKIKLLIKYLKRPRIDPLRLPSENKSLMGFNLIWLYDRVELMREMLQGLMDLKIGAQHVGHVFEWEQMHEAIRQFQLGRTTGKVVVKTDLH